MAWPQTTVLLDLTNTVWQYNQQGTELHGTGWDLPGYNDTVAGWEPGRALLAREDNNQVTNLINTVLSLTNLSGQRITSYWFRTQFYLPDDPATLGAALRLTASNHIDDGYVMYLNGTEVDRFMMPTGAVAATTLASQIFLAEPVRVVRELCHPASLVQGTNILAVEVHQQTTNDSDVVWGMALFSTIDTQPPALLRAVGRLKLDEVLVSFSERVNIVNLNLTNIAIASADGSQTLTITSGFITNMTNVLFTTTQQRNTNLAYRITFGAGSGVADLCGANSVAAGTQSLIDPEAMILAIDGLHSWRYEQSGTNLGTIWRQTTYNDSGWLSGFAVFDASTTFPGRTNVRGETVRTQLALTNANFPSLSAKIPTYYFRTHFNFPINPAAAGGRLSLSPFIDDSALIYINGQEAARVGLTNGVAVPFATYGAAVGGRVTDAFREPPLELPLTNVVMGDNVLAVELKQSAPNSSDITMAAELIVTIPLGAAKPFSLSQPQSRTNLLGSTATFSVAATGAQPLSYRWRRNGVPLTDGGRASGSASTNLVITNLHLSDAAAFSVVISNAFGVVTSAAATLTVEQAVEPELKGTWPVTGLAEARDVAVQGQFAYVAQGSNGLAVINVSDPASPVRVGGTNTIGFAQAVVVSGNYAYLVAGGLRIIDISNPANPIQVGNYSLSGSPQEVAVAGDFAYITDDNGQRIEGIYVGNPASPVRTDRLGLGGSTRGVAVSGAYAYVASSQDGLQVVNISNPSNMVAVTNLSLSGQARDVAVAGNYAYVTADNPSGGPRLHVIDVSNPASPLRVGGYSLDGSADGVAVSGNYAYVADGDAGLQVFDVSTPANPVWIGTYDTIGTARNVAVSGSCAFVADGTNGLVIVQVGPAPPLITRQPQSQTNFVGTSVTLSVSCIGTKPLAFQWQKNGFPLSNAGRVSGATSTNLVLVDAQTSDSGAYTVVVSNFMGSVTSAVATLSVPTRTLANPDFYVLVRNTTLILPIDSLVTNDVAGSANPSGSSLRATTTATTATHGGAVSLMITQSWLGTYNTANSASSASDLRLDLAGDVYVTGSSGSTNTDWITIKYSNRGNPLWTNRYDGSAKAADAPVALAVDAVGGVYVTGSSMSLINSNDYVTVNYSQDGIPRWTNYYDGPAHSRDAAVAVALDVTGNVFVTGSAVASDGSDDYVTIKYSAAGKPLWTNVYSGQTAMRDAASALATDAQGNVYVTGSSSVAINTNEYLTIKYSSNGSPIWTNRYNDVGTSSQAKAVALDTTGNVYVTGSSSTSDGVDYATIKYSPDGSLQWAKRYIGGGSGNLLRNASALGVDAMGNVYVTGDTFLWPTFGDYFSTIKYSSSGIPLWTNQHTGLGTNARATALALDREGNVYVTGESAPNPQSDNYATIKYSPNGLPLWTNLYGNLASSARPTAIDVDVAGNVYVTGRHGNSYATVKYGHILSYAPPLNFVGTDSFSYTVFDGTGASVTGQVFIAVTFAPSVSLLIPANGAKFTAPGELDISVQASDLDGVSRVDFYAGTKFIGAATSLAQTNLVASLTWSNVVAGVYTLTAVAMDNLGIRSTSAPVNIEVIAPLFLAQEGNGTVTVSPIRRSYEVGDVLTLQATPTNYYRFLRWSDGVTNSVRSVTIGLTNRFTAIFIPTQALEVLVFQGWDRSFGGSNDDRMFTLRETADGGLVFGGSSSSETDGNKSGLKQGGTDMWIVRADADGYKLWDLSLGGTNDDTLKTLALTPDGGMILGGASASPPSGNKTSPQFGQTDFWAVRLDTSGRVIWERAYGGSSNDCLFSLAQTFDSGFILGGTSDSSPSGNKTSTRIGGRDYWVVRLDGSGNKLWERSLGGTSDDDLVSLRQTRDGGFILGGYSRSGATGTKTSASFGGADFWVVRLDPGGIPIWQRSFGGNTNDQLHSVQETSDGGFILAGWSTSGISGNKTNTNFGGSDFWIVRLQPSGDALWQRSFGGTANEGEDDRGVSVIQLQDGGFLVSGSSASGVSGNKTSPTHGTNDLWVVRLDAQGNAVWDQSFGGSDVELSGEAIQTTDGGFALGGSSRSSIDPTNKTSAAYGSNDFWLVKAVAREAPEGMPVVLINGKYSPSNHWALLATNAVEIKLMTTFTNGPVFPDGIIYFTLDGSDPIGGEFYTDPITVTQSVVVRAVAFDELSGDSVEADSATIDVLPYYILTTWTEGGGELEVYPPGGAYLTNANVTLTARPASGWVFLRWQGDATSSDPVIHVTMDRSKAVEAVFGTFLITTSIGDGTTLRYPAEGPYPFGYEVRLSALPNPGRYFVSWTGAALGHNENPLLFPVTNANPQVSAFFLPTSQRVLTVLASGDGTVAKNPDRPFYSNGTNVMLTATPNPGSFFAGWSGDASGTANPLSVLMNTNRTITANFAVTNVSAAPANRAPTVHILSPSNGVTFAAPADVVIQFNATDPDGTISTVDFFSGADAIEVVFETASIVRWSNVPVGEYTLRARATDNLGLSITSAPVNIVVSTPAPSTPLFQLGSAEYTVKEDAGSVMITVLKSPGSGPGAVSLVMSDGSAQFSGFIGDYLKTSISLSFQQEDTVQQTNIFIHDDAISETTEDFTVSLAPGSGVALTNPHTAIVYILDDDPPAMLERKQPDPLPALGLLQVTLEHTNAFGQWRFFWEALWRDSGVIVPGLPVGFFEIEYRPVDGYIEPVNHNVEVKADTLITLTNYYTETNRQVGSLTVDLAPTNVLSQARWQRQGETNWHSSGEIISDLPQGDYVIQFDTVMNWIAPRPRACVVVANQLARISENYVPAQESPGAPPSPRDFNVIVESPNPDSPSGGFPYGYCGQIQSDIGFGSGFVVQERVVLTAAHVLFDDSRLSYVTGVGWFFQRQRGAFEPRPQVPRGFYVFEGYAAQRTNDLSTNNPNRVLPGEGTLESRGYDAAALYFLEAAGRGGFGGYVTSDAAPNEWLTGPRERVLVGYPVETVPVIDQGKMHAAGPFTNDFTRLSTNQVYATTAVKGFGGMSGGPLCVLHTNGAYYPAAIFLGGSGHTVVRAIDGTVVDLINRAVNSGHGGQNDDGGGVITFTVTGSSGDSAFLEVRIEPPAARTDGRWRLDQPGSVFQVSGAGKAVSGGDVVNIIFKPVPGFELPTNQLVRVPAGQDAVVTGHYYVKPPFLRFDHTSGLSIAGTTGAVYRVEFTSELRTNTVWSSLTNVTLATSPQSLQGTQPQGSGQRFYRALLPVP